MRATLLVLLHSCGAAGENRTRASSLGRKQATITSQRQEVCVPTVVARGAPPVAVRAPDIALRQFRHYSTPWAVAHHLRSISNLGAANMIELQHDGVSLAAIHAWVGNQVRSDSGDVHSDAPALSRLRDFHVMFAVAAVPLALVGVRTTLALSLRPNRALSRKKYSVSGRFSPQPAHVFDIMQPR